MFNIEKVWVKDSVKYWFKMFKRKGVQTFFENVQ